MAARKKPNDSAIVQNVTQSEIGSVVTQVYLDNTLKSDIACFVLDRKVAGLRERSLSYYRNELGYFAAFLEKRGVKQTTEITPAHIREYLVKLAETRNAGGVHAMFRAIRAFLRWWAREYSPTDWSDPTEKVTVKSPKIPPLAPVKPEDFKKILSVAARTGAAPATVLCS